MKRTLGAGLALGIASILVMAAIASCLSKTPRDDSIATPSPVPVAAPDAVRAASGDSGPVPAGPSSRPAPGVSVVVSAEPAARGRDDADALFEDERWLEAGEAYMDVLASFPEHPGAEAILERAFEAYEWIESERQVAVLEEIFRRFPAKRTPARLFERAILRGVHVDPASAVPAAELALAALPPDAFRVYALRRVAGLCRAAGDRRREELLLEESRELASALGDARTAAEIEGVLAGSAARE